MWQSFCHQVIKCSHESTYWCFFAGQLFYFHSLNCWMLITFFVTFSFRSKYIVIVFILHLALSSTLKYTVDIAINCSSRTDWVRDQDQNLFSQSLNLNHQHFRFAIIILISVCLWCWISEESRQMKIQTRFRNRDSIRSDALLDRFGPIGILGQVWAGKVELWKIGQTSIFFPPIIIIIIYHHHHHHYDNQYWAVSTKTIQSGLKDFMLFWCFSNYSLDTLTILYSYEIWKTFYFKCVTLSPLWKV